MKHRLTAFTLSAVLLSSAVTSPAADANDNTVRMKLSGASPVSTETSDTGSKVTSHFFGRDYQAKMRLPEVPSPKAIYHNIYPGIDLTCYGDEFQLEYIFTVSPGADPSLIKLLPDGAKGVSVTHTGAIRILIPGGEIIQNVPLIVIQSNGTQTKSDGSYNIGYGGIISVNPGDEFNKRNAKINGTIFNIVPSGGQPGGPAYDFHLSRYEVYNAQYLRFLNDAEANTNTPRGSNMFFDKLGNVWINPRMKRGSDELFEIAGSRISYDGDKPAGSRFGLWQAKNGKSPYAYHPVTGISWFGAVKYCNWLTIAAGRSVSDCCYTEGTNTLEWAPVTATNWAKGSFSDAERQAWLKLKGFRLPMLGCQAGAITTNSFNEFYKAAAWSSVTNKLFAFGRNSFEGTDANFADTIEISRPQTFPVGFFDGNRHLGSKLTQPNENFYGIFDLSGNVSEWMNDFGTPENPATRAMCGGSYDETPKPLTDGKAIAASSTSMSGGFRTTTTYLPMEMLSIHILYSFFLEQDVTSQKLPPEGTWGSAPLRTAPAAAQAESQEPPPAKGSSGPLTEPERASDNISPDGISYKPGVLEAAAAAARGERMSAAVPVGEGEGRGEGIGTPATIPSTPGHHPVVPPETTNFTLRVTSSSPDSGVWISINPADNSGLTSGSTTFTRTYKAGQVITLNAPTNSGSRIFRQWLNNGSFYSANHIATITMVTNMEMTAVYSDAPVVTNRLLTVNSRNPDSGVLISINPADTSGRSAAYTSFSHSYLDGTVVVLDAPTNAGSRIFQQWLSNGAFYSANHLVSIAMLTNITMTAVYSDVPVVTNRLLTVNSRNPDSGVLISINPADTSGRSAAYTSFSHSYLDGTVVVLDAPTNAEGNIFQQWLNNGAFYSTNHIVSIAMLTNITMTAVYVTPPINYTLTVQSSSPIRGVPIVVSPPDNSSQADGNTSFTRQYGIGSFVTLTAPTNVSGNVFQKWQTDGISTTNRTITIFMNANHTAIAIFIYQPGPIEPPPISPAGV